MMTDSVGQKNKNYGSTITWTFAYKHLIALPFHEHPVLIKTYHPAKSYLDAWHSHVP